VNTLLKRYLLKKDKQNKTKKKDGNDLPPNKGKLQADATVADQYITFPTDAKLLNESRKKLEQMIDQLYAYDDKLQKNQEPTDGLLVRYF